MKNNLEIRYRHLPEDITDSFKQVLEKTDMTFQVIHNKKEYFDYTGGPADILIHVDPHLTNIIIDGILFEVMKSPFVLVWKKLVQYYKQKKIKVLGDKNYIELNFMVTQENTIQFELNGNINETVINTTINKVFEYLKDKSRHDKDLKNPDLRDSRSIKPRIRLRFNQKAQTWEPINFNEIKKQIQELERRAQQNLND